MSDTMAITEISLDDLDLVTGGRARETLGRWGSNVGGFLDNSYDAAVAFPGQVRDVAVATGKALGNAAVYASDSVRTGMANGLDAAANFVRPPCRQ